MGLFNLQGQFGGMFDNWRMNQYNQQYQDWQDRQAQYEQDMDYWGQMNEYDMQSSRYADYQRGGGMGPPTAPREQPGLVGGPPPQPEMWGGGGGMGGGWGDTGWSASPFQGGGAGMGMFEGNPYEAPAAWDQRGIDTAGMVDPSAVIAGAQPGIMENMQNAFADAGNRFGSSGMVGTPYAQALGTAARGAANDIANVTNQYQFRAASDAANRDQQRAMAEYQGNLGAWGRQGDWQHGGQMGDQNRALAAWGQAGDWQQQDANRAQQQWMAQNDWRFQDYQNQQNQMMQMMPMFLQMMQGGY